MGASSSILRPQELSDFRKVNKDVEGFDIPESSDNRKLTDRKGFVIFGIALLIFIPILAYDLAKSDIRRYTHGYDSCGNLCGYNNSKIDDIPCSGVDYRNQKYTVSNAPALGPSPADNFIRDTYLDSKCVSSCPEDTITSSVGYYCIPSPNTRISSNNFGKFNAESSDAFDKLFNNHRLQTRSVDDSDFDAVHDIQDALQYCRTNWWKFLFVIAITIALCVFVLVLLRYVPAVVVWGVLVITLLIIIAAVIISWIAVINSEDSNDITNQNMNQAYMAGAVILTVFGLIAVLLFICVFKKIPLVIQLYKETTKAIFAMPLLLAVPVLITIIQVIVFVLFLTTTAWLLTSREIYKRSDNFYQYEMNGVMAFGIFFNFVMTSWVMQTIAGIQVMVISGSVAAWFFCRNKDSLKSPIVTSFYNALKFHLGTLIFGGLIIILMRLVRALVRSLFKNRYLQCLIDACCASIQAFLIYLSKNAYIETAIHGQSFLRSGKRAAKLLLSNAGSVIAINSVGDFVLGMIQVFLLVITTGIASSFFTVYQYMWLPVIICFLINIVIIIIVFGIFETTIDTLFICFCEDSVINDGLSKPYYMSSGLMEFVENSKKIYGKNERL